MEEINKTELNEIIQSYGLRNLTFDHFRQVEPDTALYIFHDKRNQYYCLIATDYLPDVDMPYDFLFDYYADKVVSFKAVKQFSYVDGATKNASGYIDDKHHRTKASTGDVCMLFAIDNLKI